MTKAEKLYAALQESAAAQAQLKDTYARARLEREREQLRSELKLLRAQLLARDREIAAMLDLQQPIETYTIKPTASRHVGEATLFWVASDWHIEELVDPATVNRLNAYNLDESRRRADLFFTRGLRLMQMLSRDVAITNVVMPLLGDFISNSIHADLAESNLLPPTKAGLRWVEYITSGLAMVLTETKKAGTRFYVPCKTGNHGRMTKDRRVLTEDGNSLEAMMYAQVRDYFRHEPRLTFDLSPAYHSFVDCYGFRVRVHHGHNIRYWGGVGGPTISINKAIAGWNTAKPADLDVFGHLHQYIDHDNFVANGSMIGWNAFAISIKASFQKPKQAFFLIDKKRGKSVSAPIMFD